MTKKELRQLQDMVLLWTIAWALLGLVLGIVQLFRTGQVSWIPSLGLGGAAGGLGMGILYSILMILTENWRDSLADTPGVLAQAGPQVFCGAAAGLIPGLVAGGLSGGLFFGAIAACTALAFNWKSVQEGLRPRVTGRKPGKAKGPATR